MAARSLSGPSWTQVERPVEEYRRVLEEIRTLVAKLGGHPKVFLDDVRGTANGAINTIDKLVSCVRRDAKLDDASLSEFAKKRKEASDLAEEYTDGLVTDICAAISNYAEYIKKHVPQDILDRV